MESIKSALQRLADAPAWRYRAAPQSNAEPAAWSALALAAAGELPAALRPAQWLAERQQPNGSVGVSASQTEPCWPTSLALLAWSILARHVGVSQFRDPCAAAVTWSLADRGRTAPQSVHIGHNTELTGWSWAAATHSWLEPTAMFVLGLRAAGHGDDPRVREGVQLLIDRLLPQGGANYGNTIVLGQPLVAHLQPTGLALIALAGEPANDSRIAASLDFLRRSTTSDTAPASLAYSLLGLAAQGQPHDQTEAWIAAALSSSRRRPLSEYELALLTLAAQPPDRWLPAASLSTASNRSRETAP